MSTPTTWAATEDNIGGNKVGDRVRMFRNASGHDGENGTVRGLDRDHGWRVWVHPDGAPYGLAVRMDPDDLERIVAEVDLPDATPAPLDPSKAKAPEPGDTLVWTNSGIEVRVTELTPAAVVFAWANGAVGQLPWSEWFNYLQPAPEPEPMPGVPGIATVEGKAGVHGTWVRSLNGENYFATHHAETSTGNLAHSDDVHDFVPDATATCAHGQTAEELCNAMPDKVELDAMWTAWKSLTPAEQRGWLEGGEGKVPTPAKVSIRTLMNGGAS